MTRAKICGLMGREDIQLCAGAGADSLGFVTEYPVPIPWNIPRDRARELVATVPPFVTTTAVVGGAVEDMLAIARTVRPHFLQLHGDESMPEIRAVCQALAGTGMKVLKALRIDIDSGKALFPETDDPVKAASILAGSGIAGLVVDSKTASRPAGTGVTLNWGVVRGVSEAVSIPLILAGGLNARNVGQAIAQVRPYAVDVISGVEAEAGVKDPRLVREFVAAVRRA